ncbi:MAG: class I SAM-dependent methyltransferase [Acidimicrobiales bacterium]|nr:class I SAM-dependent methyltransferase [Acidimicrobiales bacterium]
MYDLFSEVGEAHWWFEGRRQVVEAVMGEFLPPNWPGEPTRPEIIDIGCGTGAMLGMLGGFGHVTGLEMFEEAVAHCRAQYGDVADIRLGQIPDDLPTDGSFDVACAFDVIEHIEDDRSAVERIHDLVRPGGLFVSAVPAFPSLWGDTDVLSHHFRRYRRRPYVQLLEQAGFQVEKATYFNTWLFPAAATVRIGSRVLRRGDATPKPDLELSSKRVDRVLTKVFASERHLVERTSLPFGVSLLAVARRPAESGAPRTGTEPDSIRPEEP